jgi:predicted negative regulator of RcsB-dependent stress response
MTEEEQLEIIKKWWNKHNSKITTSLAVLLLCFSAYKYWSWHQEKVVIQASNNYEHMMLASADKNDKDIEAYANALIKEYGKTVYADGARLLLAKQQVKHNNYKAAGATLEKVMTDSKIPALKQVARIRVARLLAAEKSYDSALTTLNSINDQAYMSLINELKGDIFVALGRYQEAILSYKDAIKEANTQGMEKQFLEMKTNALLAVSKSSNENSEIKAA